MANVHDFTAKTIDGQDKNLGDYKGRVLLVVNVASACGLTPQYAGLEELYKNYSAKGLDVLGFPCNQFGGQEPAPEAEIKKFCRSRYDVTFPMFSKIEVNGPGRHPLYAFLTGEQTQPEGPGDIKWNFGKFLIDRSGNVVARFSPPTAPVSEEVVSAIEKTL
jgi:glutathione peroxidase